MSTRAKLEQLEQMADAGDAAERCPRCGRAHVGLTMFVVMPDERREPRSWCCRAPMPEPEPAKWRKVLALELVEAL